MIKARGYGKRVGLVSVRNSYSLACFFIYHENFTKFSSCSSISFNATWQLLYRILGLGFRGLRRILTTNKLKLLIHMMYVL